MISIGGYLYYFENVIQIFTDRHFKGWGRKRTGRFASWCHKIFGGELLLLEDGFIASFGPLSFSMVEDDRGIYYDATVSSKLETLLNTYAFEDDDDLMKTAKMAMKMMQNEHISKYNSTSDIDADFFKNDTKSKVLIVAQTAEDASLKYGKTTHFSTKKIIEDAISENPNASIYIKLHPDALSGKKKSDIVPEEIVDECCIIDINVNPISLLKYFDKIYTKTSGMGMEALVLGKKVICYGMPYYAGWGVTDDRAVCERRKRKLSVEEIFAGAYIVYSVYRNPYTKEISNIIDTMKDIKELKKINMIKNKDLKGYFFGFSLWKHSFVSPFFCEYEKKNLFFINPVKNKDHLSVALKKGLNKKSKIYIWGRKSFKDVEKYAQQHDIEIFHVEDGFIRSVSLGSDLTQPYSLVVDSRGIYFDPMQESDLEYLLQNHNFRKSLLERAKGIRSELVRKKISKYNSHNEVLLDLPKNKYIIFVPGQVDDDASVEYGTDGMSNLKLLQEVREKCPDSFIVYKPHPDVLAGNRKGDIEEKTALKYCNLIVKTVSIDSILAKVDEVHTMTSLVGFEALLRDLKVHTYGMPFYAGWGLTIDHRECKRRRRLTIDELVVATLILYPRYIDAKSKTVCTIETVMKILEAEKRHYIKSKPYKSILNTRNYISRKLQKIISIIKNI
jgi:capsular polysaccharide export protein